MLSICLFPFVVGIISLRLTDNKLSTLIKDATQISVKAINWLRIEGKLKPPPSSCNEQAGLWETGDILYKYEKNLFNSVQAVILFCLSVIRGSHIVITTYGKKQSEVTCLLLSATRQKYPFD